MRDVLAVLAGANHIAAKRFIRSHCISDKPFPMAEFIVAAGRLPFTGS